MASNEKRIIDFKTFRKVCIHSDLPFCDHPYSAQPSTPKRCFERYCPIWKVLKSKEDQDGY